MHVGLIIDAYDPLGGGAERWTAGLRQHLLQRGHRVTLVTFALRNCAPPEDLILLTDPGTLLGRAAAVADVRARLPGAVLHDSGTGWSADIFHPQTGSRLLSMDRLHAALPGIQRLALAASPRLHVLRWKMAQIEKRAARSATRVVAVSRYVGAYLIGHHGADAGSMRYIANGADLARFGAERLGQMRAAARAGLGLQDELLFLSVAHNLLLKGADTSLRALAQVIGRTAQVRLVVAGGQPDAQLRHLADRLGLAAHVTWAGDVKEMEPLYAAADAMLHPTRWDACSLATIEAMAAGLPVVTTRDNGAADLIEDGRSGIILQDARDFRALGETIHRLRDPDLRRAIGSAARLAAAGADLQENFSRVEDLLLEVEALRLQKSRA